MSAQQSPSRAEIADEIERQFYRKRLTKEVYLKFDAEQVVNLIALLRQSEGHDNGSTVKCPHGINDALNCDVCSPGGSGSKPPSHDNGSSVVQGERERIKRILGSWPMHKDDRGPDNLVLADMLPGGYEEQDAMLGQIADALLSQGREQSTAGDTRQCTCHPDDNPPIPCARKYAFSECNRARNEELAASRAEVQALMKKLERFVRIADKGLFRDGAGLSLAAHPLVDEARTVLASLSAPAKP